MRRDTWMGLGIAGVACLLMGTGPAIATPDERPSMGPVEPLNGAPRILLAQSGSGDTESSEDSAQPAVGSPPATQAPMTGTGMEAQQAPASGTAPAAGTNTAVPNTGVAPGTGGAGSANTGANPGAGAAGNANPGATPSTGGAGNAGTDADANPFDGSPSADPDPEARGSNVNAGGNGNPATGANPGTGGTGTGATGAPAAAPAPAAQEGIAVVDAIYTGVVTKVSSKEVVIVDAGTRLPLEIGTGTRILRDGQAIRVNQLKEGEKVRAVVNIVGKSHTREIAVLSKDAARRAAGLR
ncbi:hypothetical protein G4177_00065 [Corallococcus sp. ZKHCc1 1396]|uniref:DUF5666 domain-containing protein n=1 Tax=Corallococcus soli TaxID=2710757 RepID=A0ABR9PF62_9BACT|nr:hypothetical protein [Corallococcus soli]MBE4746563.1 hypothetical protein [Corallococcus soli]